MPLIHVRTGDITAARADAIVTSAGPGLEVSGGVNGAIHAAAGPELAEACRALGGCPVGEVRTTAAGWLHARRVVHAVAPRWAGGEAGERVLLGTLYAAIVRAAAADGCAALAVPSIATGTYGFPVQDAAAIAVDAVSAALDDQQQVRLVRFWVADEESRAAYAAVIGGLPGYRREVRRDDMSWESLQEDPFSDTRPLPFRMLLGEDEAAFVKAGTTPVEMEDRWFVFHEGGTVHFHRSWTGYEQFSLRMRPRPDGEPGALLDQLQVCDDPARNAGTDEQSLEHATNIVRWLASGVRYP